MYPVTYSLSTTFSLMLWKLPGPHGEWPGVARKFYLDSALHPDLRYLIPKPSKTRHFFCPLFSFFIRFYVCTPKLPQQLFAPRGHEPGRRPGPGGRGPGMPGTGSDRYQRSLWGHTVLSGSSQGPYTPNPGNGDNNKPACDAPGKEFAGIRRNLPHHHPPPSAARFLPRKMSGAMQP